jgi:hypothetical protein
MEVRSERPTGAVYFPYINAPKNDWFAQTLLYWDEVACIVPAGFDTGGPNRRRLRFDGRTPAERYAHTLYLRDLGLVRVLEPELPPDEIWPFVEEFLQLIERDPAYATRRRWKTAQLPGVNIHRNKLGYLLTRHLGAIGLAREPRGQWASVEPNTARLFMACLASYLGDTQPSPLRPVTDDVPSYEALKRVVTRSERLADAGARDALLRNILRAPRAQDIDFYELAEFKQRHADQLRWFRTHIEAQVRRLNLIEDPASREAEADQVSLDIADELTALERLMHAQGWERLQAATVGVVSVIPTALLGLTGDTPMQPRRQGSFRPFRSLTNCFGPQASHRTVRSLMPSAFIASSANFRTGSSTGAVSLAVGKPEIDGFARRRD